jgi:hypothetical protein
MCSLQARLIYAWPDARRASTIMLINDLFITFQIYTTTHNKARNLDDNTRFVFSFFTSVMLNQFFILTPSQSMVKGLGASIPNLCHGVALYARRRNGNVWIVFFCHLEMLKIAVVQQKDDYRLINLVLVARTRGMITIEFLCHTHSSTNIKQTRL